MGALPVTKLTVEEYLALDRASDSRLEYYDGEVFPMQAGTMAHSLLIANASLCLGERLRRTPCRVATASLRVRVTPAKFVYPDALVFCGNPLLTDEQADTITNPKVIIEVLSPSTGGFDYSNKLAFYRNLASFEEYLLISQDRPHVDVFRKGPDGRWILNPYTGLDTTIVVESLGIQIPMAELYDRIDFPDTADVSAE